MCVNNLPKAVTRIKAEQQAVKFAALSRQSNALTVAQLQCVYGSGFQTFLTTDPYSP